MQSIRTESKPNCPVCQTLGNSILQDQPDRLFGAPGEWHFKKCRNAQCGLVWLDPVPLVEDIGKAYLNYYTHKPKKKNADRILNRLYEQIAKSYRARKFGYSLETRSKISSVIGYVLYFFPLRRKQVEAEVRFLPAIPHGRLLDVGCGAGEWLEMMRDLGWQAEGVDFDNSAVRAANERGLNVKCGSLEQQEYPSNSFDAVVLNHVIEHVFDPEFTITECFRVLKKGGSLVIFTPNCASLGAKIFGERWRGLEPPRHIQIFTIPAMRNSLIKAGFRDFEVRPQIVWTVIYDSLLLWRGIKAPSMVSKIIAKFVAVVELCVVPIKESCADCLVAIAKKQ